jgi:muramidase (phage lysozyme)
MHFESHGNYRAQNPTDTASGAYQFVNTTWMAITGLPGPAKAYSPAIQDHAFYVLFANGRGAHNWATWPLCASL